MLRMIIIHGTNCKGEAAFSPRHLRPCQQLGEVVVHARHAKVWLAPERAAHVVHAVRIVWQELDDGENEVLGFIERVEDLILRDGDRRCPRDAAFHFEEAQVASAWVTALDVIAQFVKLTVHRVIAKLALYGYDNRAGTGGYGLRVHRL